MRKALCFITNGLSFLRRGAFKGAPRGGKVCPQSLPRLELRYRRGFRPEAKRGGIRLLLENGYCFPLKEGRINEHREALGLPPLVFAPEAALKTLLAEAAAMAEREER